MADFRYPFTLQKYLFNRGLVSSPNYKPLIDDIHFQVATVTSSNAILQGNFDEISGTIIATPVSSGVDVSLQGSVGELGGSLIYNVSEDLILQGSLGDISGQIVSNTATNSTLQSGLEGVSGQVILSASTNAALQGSFEEINSNISISVSSNAILQSDLGDISGTISVGAESTNASLQGSFDDIFGQLQATVSTDALLQGSLGDISGLLQGNVNTNALLHGELDGLGGSVIVTFPLPTDIILTGSLNGIDGFINANVINTPLEVIRVKGVGKKSNKKALTYKERKDLDEKVFEVLFDLAKDVADKADISGSFVTTDVVSNLVDDVVNSIKTSDISKIVLEESAKLQTDLILRNLRRKQRNREDEELMLLF